MELNVERVADQIDILRTTSAALVAYHEGRARHLEGEGAIADA